MPVSLYETWFVVLFFFFFFGFRIVLAIVYSHHSLIHSVAVYPLRRLLSISTRPCCHFNLLLLRAMCFSHSAVVILVSTSSDKERSWVVSIPSG